MRRCLKNEEHKTDWWKIHPKSIFVFYLHLARTYWNRSWEIPWMVSNAPLHTHRKCILPVTLKKQRWVNLELAGFCKTCTFTAMFYKDAVPALWLPPLPAQSLNNDTAFRPVPFLQDGKVEWRWEKEREREREREEERERCPTLLHELLSSWALSNTPPNDVLLTSREKCFNLPLPNLARSLSHATPTLVFSCLLPVFFSVFPSLPTAPLSLSLSLSLSVF